MKARLQVTSVFVDDQDKALAFYTEKLGFVPKTDVPAGEYRWLTVVGADDPDGVELLLEPDVHPAAKEFKRALVKDGIPMTSFLVDDVTAAHRELEAAGVVFAQPPTPMGGVIGAVLDDTCGNLILIASPVVAETS
jgi:catechol 2,3-dioxygenase-like lactoylglutathione lyase family enzyme